MVRPGVAASCLTLVLVLVTIWSQAQPEKVRQVGEVGQVRLAAQTGEILHQAFLPTPQPQPLFSLSLPARNLRLPALTMRGVSSVIHLSLSPSYPATSRVSLHCLQSQSDLSESLVQTLLLSPPFPPSPPGLPDPSPLLLRSVQSAQGENLVVDTWQGSQFLSVSCSDRVENSHWSR